MSKNIKVKKWILYLLWIILLALILAGIWWYYGAKIKQIDHKMDSIGEPAGSAIEMRKGVNQPYLHKSPKWPILTIATDFEQL